MAQRMHPFSREDLSRVQAERTSSSHQKKSQLEIYILAVFLTYIITSDNFLHYLYFYN
ncbi:uncharacterized protein BT62DRAFT_934748 [Guyanagaster necrorhizus]|uniref:Uncharacterized protein n=1 Tax=Guyanagaster necrorhizus TaxID=856835 RepID=A0A9P7VNG2_9AGAR|nr:uncharacterized protein BT62DRAFT_934748 [Guyanagaster necrorhizus MCA 3950]KAG7443785.1 hypothetical protein BT62DRAFT_934748 [Guyanagaster necrorhizus MCA 3950]